MKKIVISCLSVVLLLVLSNCNNAIQVALPGILTTNTPVTDPEPGVYDHPLESIQLLCQTDGAEIHYSLDPQVTPSRNTPRYTAPLSLTSHNGELYIQAIAYKEGKDVSAEMTARFFVRYAGPTAPVLSVAPQTGGFQRPSDGSWTGDVSLYLNYDGIFEAQAAAAAAAGRELGWTKDEICFAYTTDGSAPVVDTAAFGEGAEVSAVSSGNGTLLRMYEIASTPLLYEGESVFGGGEEVTVSALAFVLKEGDVEDPETGELGSGNIGYPTSYMDPEDVVVYYDENVPAQPLVSLTPLSGGEPVDIGSASSTQSEGFRLTFEVPEGMPILDPGLCRIMVQFTGFCNGAALDDEPVELADGDSLSVFIPGEGQWPSSPSPPEGSNTVTLRAWLTHPYYNSGDEISEIFSYSPLNPRAPEVNLRLYDPELPGLPEREYMNIDHPDFDLIAPKADNSLRLFFESDPDAEIWYSFTSTPTRNGSGCVLYDPSGDGVVLPDNQVITVFAKAFRGVLESPLVMKNYISLDDTGDLTVGTPELQAEYDTGRSSEDNITANSIMNFEADIPVGTDHVFIGVDGSIQAGPALSGSESSVIFTDISLAEGLHDLSVICVDTDSGLRSESEFLTVQVDTTAPAAPYSLDLPDTYDSFPAGYTSGPYLTDNVTNITDIQMSGTCSNDTVVIHLTSDQGLSAEITPLGMSFSTPFTGLSDGTYQFSALAEDLAGNQSSTTTDSQVQIITSALETPPAPALEAAADSGISDSDNITNRMSISLEGSYSDTRACQIQVFENGALNTTLMEISGSSYENAPLTLSAEGSRSLTVRLEDSAGNLSPESSALPVQVDVTAPLINNLNTSSTSSYTSGSIDYSFYPGEPPVDITFTAGDLGGLGSWKVYTDAVSEPETINWTNFSEGLISDTQVISTTLQDLYGERVAYLEVTDLAGNTSSETSSIYNLYYMTLEIISASVADSGDTVQLADSAYFSSSIDLVFNFPLPGVSTMNFDDHSIYEPFFYLDPETRAVWLSQTNFNAAGSTSYPFTHTNEGLPDSILIELTLSYSELGSLFEGILADTINPGNQTATEYTNSLEYYPDPSTHLVFNYTFSIKDNAP